MTNASETPNTDERVDVASGWQFLMTSAAAKQAIKQHTVPEGAHLVTRSYVLNCIEFERQRVVKKKAGLE